MSQLYTIEFRAMGCRIEIRLETPANGVAILNQMPVRMEAYETILSRFRETSELSDLNRHVGEWFTVSSVLFDVVQQAKHGARRTNGLYNPLVLYQMIANGYHASFETLSTPTMRSTTPVMSWTEIGLRPRSREVYLPDGSAIDLGGIAKGWASARIADYLEPFGACLVNIGGDITVRGKPRDTNGWEIEIEDPLTSEALVTVCLTDTTIVTSGIDYRYWTNTDGQQKHHIIDPRTGISAATDVLTTTLIHPHASSAEVFAKAVMLLQSEVGLNWLHRYWQAQGLIVRQDGCVMTTNNFKRLLN